MNTTEIGDKSEAVVLAELVKKDYRVLLPFGNGRRYDFVLEEKPGQFKTVQVKTGRIKDGVIVFKSGNRAGHYREVDRFAVFCPDNEKVYLVPTIAVGVSHGYLRFEAPKNGQKAKILWAREFEL